MAFATEMLRMLGMNGDSVDATVTGGWFKIVGRTQTVGGTSVRVIQRDNVGNVLLATGTTIPVDAGAGWAKGATFVKTDAGAGIAGTYINVGTTTSALFVRTGETRTAKVSLTNVNIKALRATPITLVAAPGANLLLEFVSAVLVKSVGANALTETADNLAIRYTNGAGLIVSESIETTLFIDTTTKIMTTAAPKLDQIIITASAYNQALVLHNTGDGEFGGNAAADITMDVYTSYRVLDVT